MDSKARPGESVILFGRKAGKEGDMAVKTYRMDKLAVSLFSLILSFSTTANAKIIYVDDNGPADFNNIQTAVNNSNDGDIIEVAPEMYAHQFIHNIDFMNKDIIFRPRNPDAVYISNSLSGDPNTVRSNLTSGYNYVPSELIIKFKKTAAATIANWILEERRIHELKLSNTLDELNEKYKVRNIEALFKDFKQNRQYVQDLLKKDKVLLTKPEKRILKRLSRAPKGATIPNLDRIYKIKVDLEAGHKLEEVVAAYRSNPDVEHAELNYIVYADLEPNDSLYSLQWPLNNTGQLYPESGKYNTPPGTPDCDIDAPEAWDIHIGSSEIIVAVADTGVDYTHRDLQENIWTNEAELNGIAGIDDDGNEYVDDIYGYDFINNDSDPRDDHGHGTHCSGVIAAKSNNGLDISGVCWHAKIMGLKFLGSSGSGPISDAIEAFYYAVNNGADVISNSWGGGYVQAAQDAVDYAYSQGVIVTASAGNSGDTCHHYPANYEHVISVAATNSNDERASFSTYGDWVDIAAPGVDVLSLRATGTSMGTTYDSYTTIASGTSMACPHVSGACAILLAAFSEIIVDEVSDTLKQSADPIESGICQSGRLNIYEALLAIPQPKGLIRLDQEAYACLSNINVWLSDSDLMGNGTREVILTTSGGDLETIALIETPASIGIFRGTIPTNSTVPNIKDGVLQIMHGQIITARYEDANDGTGSPAVAVDTATADCQGPDIFNVQIDIPGPEPTVTFETNEPSKTRVWCGLICEDPNLIVKSHSTLATKHSIKLLGVYPETEYFFIIEATDSAGNKTIGDNEGQCYNFTTTAPGDINVPNDYLKIQEAIDHSWNSGTVLVADGIYYGYRNRDIDFKGKAITVRSENGPENCVVDCDGTSTGFYFHNSEGPNSVLDGFTITGGSGRFVCGPYGCTHQGGGIFCYRSSPIIKNCIVTNNTADYGGGIVCGSGSATITDCIIKSNSSGRGGGIYTFSNATISNCIIINNYAGTDGGGGVYGSKLRITNCVIAENSTGSRSSGGGVVAHCTTGDNIITNCTVVNNSAGADDGYGGGISCYCSDTTITNCIVRGNSAKYGGQIAMWSWAQAERANVTVSYSNIQGGESSVFHTEYCTFYWGAGNIDEDPNFIDPAPVEYRYHILNDSPCIDAGTNTPAGGLPPTDGDGNPRVADGDNDGTAVVDMGSFEYDPCTMPPVLLRTPAEFELITPLGTNPAVRIVSISNGGGGILDWSIEENCPWLEIIPSSGECTVEVDEVTLSIDVNSLTPGVYTYSLIISSNNSINSPISLDIILLYATTTLHVPSNYPTIQAAIDALKMDNFTIKVADGVYTGAGNTNINFKGKAITVKSENGPANCIIDCENKARGFIFNTYEENDSILEGFTITNGFSSDFGGGMYFSGSSPTVMNCKIIRCRTTNIYGGGLYCSSGSAKISNCLISLNSSGREGGGICCKNSANAIIRNCIISYNTASDGGGIKIRNDNGYAATIKDCLILGNTTDGICSGYCMPKIQNCTITNNTGVGFRCSVSSKIPTVKNCIIWGNSSGGISKSGGTPIITYNDIQGGWSGIGNISADPSFVAYPSFVGAANNHYHSPLPPIYDYHLRWNSPCINKGDPAYTAGDDELDIDGEPRIMGGRIDMGFDEVGEKQADLNRNGIINFEDIMLFVQAWLSNPGEDIRYILCDLYQDNQIDFADWAELAKDWLWQADWYEP